MNIDKTIKLVSEKLNINEKEALELFENYWKFIEERLEKTGLVDIPNFGTFMIEYDEKEKDYKITFNTKKELTNTIFGVENE
ncbi:MAG TPA: HU family DNA-binding protein [Spirochaetota bacterium]|nr:HU family DNA-binding protein [Spirochaetota bacterium]